MPETRIPGQRLRRMVEMAEKSMKASAETIAELAQAYRDGVGTPELRRRYGLSQGSVLQTAVRTWRDNATDDPELLVGLCELLRRVVKLVS